MNVILIIGNPVDGLHFVGPFDTADEANEYAEVVYDDEEWWSVALESPKDES